MGTITSVITGDIIKSRTVKNASIWLQPLKKVLSLEGSTPKTWEIFRGDSFQIEIKKPEEAMLSAIRIKATIKSIKNLDVRMGIGIGAKQYSGQKITESNGDAFVRSGEQLEALKKSKQNLAISTPWPEFDHEMNLYIRFAMIVMDNWTTGAAELAKLIIDNQQITQTMLAKKLKITQSSVSERKQRTYLTELMDLEQLYKEKLNQLR
jgi:predicted XRE-type DNA-binding protein